MRIRTTNLKLIPAFISFVTSVLFTGYISLSTDEAYASILMICIWFYLGWIFFDKNMSKHFSRPTVFLFTIINAIRYVTLPALILVGTLSAPVPQITPQGCALYLYEEIVVCMFMSIILKRVYRKENVGEITKENSYLIYAVMILLGLVAVVMSPGILNTYNFIFSHSSVYSSLRVTNVLNGMWGIIYKIAFLLFPCLLSFFFYRIYSKTNSKLFMVLAIGTLLFTTLGFSEGTSRNSALIPAMAAMFLLLRCFPKKKKTILISIGVIIVGGFIVMTTAKLAFINSYSGKEMAWNLKGITNMIEAYFSGPANFSTSIKAKDSFESMFTFTTWFDDLFGNWPVLSSFVDPANRTTTFYNMMYYGKSLVTDQIIPTTGQGLFHFGYIFSVVPICLFIYISAMFDVKASKTNDYVKTYIYSYIAVRFAMSLIANISIMSAFIGAPLIEILFIIFLAEKLPHI